MVWRLSMGLPPFVSPLPAHGHARSQISILGTNLTGATTGPIQVTLADGTVLSSNVTFHVR